MAPMNVLLVTLDQFRGDCLSVGRAPRGADPEPRPPGRRRGAPRPPLQPGGSRAGRAGRVSTRARTSSTTASSATARRSTPASTTSPARRGGRGTCRPSSATPTRASTARPRTGPDDPRLSHLSGLSARLRRRPRPPRRAGRVAGVARAPRLRRARRRRGRPGHRAASAPPSTACPPSSPTPSSRGSSARTDRGSPTPATGARTRRTRRPGHWSTAYDPDDVPAATTAARPRHPLLRAAGGPARARGSPGRPPTRRRSTSAWSPTSTSSSAGCSTPLQRTRDVGRHRRRGHLGPRRAARRPGHPRQGRPLRVELPRPRHRPRPTPSRGARRRWSTAFTENVDIFPTICEAHGRRRARRSATACRSRRSSAGTSRRGGATRRTGSTTGAGSTSPSGPHPWPWDRRLEAKHLAVLRSEAAAYVQFGDGQWRCFDLGCRPDVAHRGRRSRGGARATPRPCSRGGPATPTGR